MFKNKIGFIITKSGKGILQLSQETGLHRKTIKRLLVYNDVGDISLNTLCKLSKVLDCKVKDLFEYKQD